MLSWANFLIMGVAFAALSCSTYIPKIDTSAFYRKDIEIYHRKTDSTKIGTMVVPQRRKHEFTFYVRGSADLVSLSTCHREVVLEKAGSFWNGSKVKYTYRPRPEMEMSGDCPLRIDAYDGNERHSFGIVGFINFETLPATVTCNGEKYVANGVSLCQSREELIQKIEFAKEVDYSFDDKCKNMVTKDNKVFEYSMQKSMCSYAFMDKETGKIHRLTTYGYNKILVIP